MRKFLIALVAIAVVITLVWAAAADLEPDSDVTTGWNNGTGTSFTEIDEGADTHNDPGSGGDDIAESSNNTTSEFGFGPTPGDFGSLNTLTIKIAHKATGTADDDPNIDLFIFDNVPVQIGATKTTTRSEDSYTVESFTDAAWDSMTQTQLDGMTVRVIYRTNASGMPDGGTTSISAITAELDYNVAGAAVRPKSHGPGPIF